MVGHSYRASLGQTGDARTRHPGQLVRDGDVGNRRIGQNRSLDSLRSRPSRFNSRSVDICTGTSAGFN